MSNSSIWPIDRTKPGAITLSQSRPGSNDNKGVLCRCCILHLPVQPTGLIKTGIRAFLLRYQNSVCYPLHHKDCSICFVLFFCLFFFFCFCFFVLFFRFCCLKHLNKYSQISQVLSDTASPVEGDTDKKSFANQQSKERNCCHFLFHYRYCLFLKYW